MSIKFKKLYPPYYEDLKKNLQKIIKNIFLSYNKEYNNNQKFLVEYPKLITHGDVSTNIAMIFAKKLCITPQELATEIIKQLNNNQNIEKIEYVAPGFINIFYTKAFWQNQLSNMIAAKSIHTYTNYNTKKNKNTKINIEYVSANPTGPLHIGHLRGALIGNILANLYSFFGYSVVKEYYVNDAGNQIDGLVASIKYRLKERAGEIPAKPENFYPGNYLIELAEEIEKFHKGEFKKGLISDTFLKKYTLKFMMRKIKDDLEKFLIGLCMHHRLQHCFHI